MSEIKNYILSEEVAAKKLRRMAYEVLEHNIEEKEIILAGVSGGGTIVAKSIQQHLGEISPVKTELITISLDKQHPKQITLDKKVDFNNKVVIIIDDVSDSGKTLLYALKPFLEYHPAKIQTLVLIERSHNSFPVHPDYIGLTIATTLLEHIYVEVDGDTVTGAYLQ